MNDNKFHILRVARFRDEANELGRACGLRPAQYEHLTAELADLMTNSVIAKASQFLLDFDDVGSMALGERHHVTDRTIRYWREDLIALNIGKKQTA